MWTLEIELKNKLASDHSSDNWAKKNVSAFCPYSKNFTDVKIDWKIKDLFPWERSFQDNNNYIVWFLGNHTYEVYNEKKQVRAKEKNAQVKEE